MIKSFVITRTRKEYRPWKIRKYFISISLVLLSHHLFSQNSIKEEIIGTWSIQKISIDTIVSFDANNHKIAYENAFKNLKKKKPGYTSEDSLQTILKIQTNLNLIGRLFITFYEDNTYLNSKLDSNKIDLSKTEEGTYKIIKKGKGLILKDSESRNKMKMLFKNNYLILESGESKKQKKIIIEYKKKK